MKKLFSIKNLCMALLTSVALMGSANVLACAWYDVPCKVKDAWNKAQQALEAAAQDAANLAAAVAAQAQAEAEAAWAQAQADAAWAQQQAEAAAALAQAQDAAIRAEAQAEADRIAAAIKAEAARVAAAAQAEAARVAAVAAVVKALADKMAADAAPLSIDTMNAIKSNARNAYGASQAGVVNGYNQSVNEMQKTMDYALKMAFRDKANAFMAANNQVIARIRSNAQNMDNEGKAALNRLIKTIGNGINNMDALGKADMALVGRKLGLIGGTVQSNIPSNVTHSSWGIFTGIGVQAIVGVSESYSLAMNTYPEPDGTFKSGLIQAMGASLGAGVGESAQYGIFWQPGAVDASGGWSVGVGLSAGTTAGGGSVGLSWGVSKGMVGAQNAVPAVALAVELPGATSAIEFNLGFSAGYNTVIANF